MRFLPQPHQLVYLRYIRKIGREIHSDEYLFHNISQVVQTVGQVMVNYGGKPSSAFPSFIVITIILTILSITILSLATFSARAKLWPNIDKPIYHEGATDDKFVILFEKEKIDEKKVTGLLKKLGAVEILEK